MLQENLVNGNGSYLEARYNAVTWDTRKIIKINLRQIVSVNVTKY